MFKPISFTKRDVPASETETVWVEGRLPGERVSRRRTFSQLEHERRRQGLEKELFYKPSPYFDSLPSYSPLKPSSLPPSPESLTQSAWDAVDNSDGNVEAEDGEEGDGDEVGSDELEPFDIDPLQQDFGDEDVPKPKTKPPSFPTSEGEEENDFDRYEYAGDITSDSSFELSSPRFVRSPSVRPSKMAPPPIPIDIPSAPMDFNMDGYENSASDLGPSAYTTMDTTETNASTNTNIFTNTMSNEDNSDVNPNTDNPMEDISEDEFEVDPFEGEDKLGIATSKAYTTHVLPPSSTPYDTQHTGMDAKKVEGKMEETIEDDMESNIDDGSEFLEDDYEELGDSNEFEFDLPTKKK